MESTKSNERAEQPIEVAGVRIPPSPLAVAVAVAVAKASQLEVVTGHTSRGLRVRVAGGVA